MVASDGWPVARREGERWAGHRDRRGTRYRAFGASSAPAQVLNCTGPATDVRRAGDPLLDALFHWGQARPDPLGLGIDVAEDGAIISGNGDASRVLYYVGPLVRARDGEGTAVPELRVHAARLAATLLGTIPAPGIPHRPEPPPWPREVMDVTL